MPTLFVSGFYFSDDTSLELAATLLGKCLPIFESYGFTPMSFAEEAWNNSTPRIFGGTSLLHKLNSLETGDPLWGAGFIYLPAPVAKSALVAMSIPANFPSGFKQGWSWLTRINEELCDSMQVELCLLNGMTITSTGKTTGGTPAGPEIAPGQPPGLLCPWMYFGSKRLENGNLLNGLNALKDLVERSSPSKKGGWVLQCQNQYSGKEPVSITDAYSNLMNLDKVHWIGVK